MINKAVLIKNIKKAIEGGVMDSDWTYDDCRLENNGLIRKGCGYNQSFKYNVPLVKMDINMGIIEWCNRYCDGKFGWYFEECSPSRSWPARQRAVMTFQSKADCFNFKLKIL
jgi:hypothetical protein